MVVGPVEGPQLVVEDPDDDPYLWAAFAGSATHLVTWDEAVLALKHYRGTQIVSPEAFYRLLLRLRSAR
jgi:predicted nucleic acid-binding protein